MLDQTSVEPAISHGQDTEFYDLVVVGAGVAGLNALNAATEYLDSSAKTLLIDQKPTAGGMWNTAYDYVRLHQPHPMFTVGNMTWGWNKPRDYLARRDEVRDHLAGALEPIAKAVTLSTAFGQTVSECREVKAAEGYCAQVTYHPNGDPAHPTTIRARQAIYAPGLNYRQAAPLELSSDAVFSIIPQDLRETLAAHPDASVYVIGGGKTGMDTILEALSENPDRKVVLVNGRGTNFLNRTRYIPTGLKRWTSGELVSRLFRDMALNFDGTNEDHTIAHFRRHHSTDPDASNGVFLYGLQSETERDRIDAGLAHSLDDYLQDVADGPDGPRMVLRSGAQEAVEPGAIFVNCTGSFFRSSEMEQALDCLSPHGSVMTINARGSFHFLTSVCGFFMTHLHYRQALRGRGFYALDHEALFRQNRNAWVGASAAQAYMNQVIAVQTLPMTLLDRCGLDLDRWYPLPRRLAGLIRMKASAQSDIAHCRHALDRVADRFGVKSAPLE